MTYTNGTSGQFTNYGQGQILSAVFGATITRPTTLFLGLASGSLPTGNSGAAGLLSGLTEPTLGTGGYARVSVGAPASGLWTPTNPGSSPNTGTQYANAAVLSFPASTAAWSSGATALAWWFLCDAGTGTTENVLVVGAIPTANQPVVNSSAVTVSFAIGQLSFSVT